MRASTAFQGAQNLVKAMDYDRAFTNTEIAVETLWEIRMPLLKLKDQHALLRQFAGLASCAAALALKVEDSASKALELLEFARARTIGVGINIRSETSSLQGKQPNLVYSYEAAVSDLRQISRNAPLRVTPQMIDGVMTCHFFSGTVMSLYRTITMRSMVEEIRSLPGYDTFLLPLAVPDMMALALDGPVVTFNISTFRSDVIIININEIQSLELPNLSFDDFQDKIGLLSGENAVFTGSIHDEPERNRILLDVLLWLWDTAVCPVLTKLGFMDQVPDRR